MKPNLKTLPFASKALFTIVGGAVLVNPVFAQEQSEQGVEKTIAQVRAFIEKNTPDGIRVDVRVLNAAPATLVDPGHPAIQVAARALEEVFQRPTVFVRCGGTIPVVGYFLEYLQVPTVLMGFGLPDDDLHAPNEKFTLSNYYPGIASVAHFLEMLGEEHD